MKREQALLALCAATLWCAQEANARPQQIEICSSDSIPLMTTSFADSVTLDRFDPALGILQSVTLNTLGTIQGQAAYESLSNKPEIIVMDFSAQVAVHRPGGNDPIDGVNPNVQFIDNAAANDGNIDFAGPSGQTFIINPQPFSTQSVAPPPFSDLALFTGPAGNPGTITLPVTAFGTSTGSGAGNLILQFLQEISVDVEVCYVYTLDCNANGIPDEQDLINGLPDCNNNGVPDECDSFDDCNNDQIPDECQLLGNDCNSNMIPDDCETDCNMNGIPDDCDLAGGAPDCNNNGIPDECELFDDCNNDNIPDECQLTNNDCNNNQIPDDCEPDCNQNNIPDECEPLDDCNNDNIPDECQLTNNDCNSNMIPDDCETDCNMNNIPDDCDLAGGEPDCNGNMIPDVCEVFVDCNNDNIPDECELAGNDCNNNHVPDDCEPDCDNNNIPDDCDLANGVPDCNNNGLPDRCENFEDCNGDQIPDECQLDNNDCNNNQVPDECEPDCDNNNVPDDCDLANGVPDCNMNGVLDRCEVFDDCNGDMIPDECQLDNNDCNSNMTPDDCEPDCDSNSVPDDCDLANGAPDLNNDGILDVCSPFQLTQCELAAIPPTTTGFAQTVDLDLFDPDFGILEGVQVRVTMKMLGEATVENLDPAPGLVTIDFGAGLSLTRPDNSTILTGQLSEQYSVLLDAFDGTLDLSGPSSHMEAGIFSSDTFQVTSPPPASDLALFTGAPGAGPPGQISLGVQVQGLNNAFGVGNLVFQVLQDVGVLVEVCYLYAPDCNMNGVSDFDELGNGGADCNKNGILDECDLANGSADQNLDQIPDECGTGADFCSGDGGNGAGCTNCPCGNNAPMGTVGGCLNSSANSARLYATGSPSVFLPDGATNDLRFSLTGAPSGSLCILNSGAALAPTNPGNPCFGLDSGAQSTSFDGLRCSVTDIRRHGGRVSDAFGDVGLTTSPWGGEGAPNAGIARAFGGFGVGQQRYFQVICRDNPALACGRGLNTTQAIEILFTP